MADPNTFGIAGLLGWPVAHARSRPAFNAWFGVMPEITPTLRQAIAATF